MSRRRIQRPHIGGKVIDLRAFLKKNNHVQSLLHNLGMDIEHDEEEPGLLRLRDIASGDITFHHEGMDGIEAYLEGAWDAKSGRIAAHPYRS